MNRPVGTATLVVSFLAFSVVVSVGTWTLFGDARGIAIWMLLSLAFLPVQVLILSLIVDRMMVRREREAIARKLNVVVGVFFGEVGTELLRRTSSCGTLPEATRERCLPKPEWTMGAFVSAAKSFKAADLRIDSHKGDLPALSTWLLSKRPFLLGLMGNPNLLEHESFTDALLAVLHVADEFAARSRVDVIAQADRAHIEGDVKRAFLLLIPEWLLYLGHLKEDYPYLYSLAVRTNPFDPNAKVEIPEG